MKRILLAALSSAMLALPAAHAQRMCGAQLVKDALQAADPAAAARFRQYHQSMQQPGAGQLQAARKTTAAVTIPVIFHIIVNNTQLADLGGYDGIARRCDSQIAVLNRDFNRQNADSTAIPAGFKPVYASANIRFGLAHTTPQHTGTPGYDVRVVTSPGFSGAATSYSSAKHTASGGLDAWDVDKYLNIWCIPFTDISGLLGLTAAKSMVGGALPPDEIGVCMLYNALGRRASPTDNYPGNFDLGRTLTHELGHFFEIWHTWGDDGGQCPGVGSGVDDGIADTPPEANNASGAPTGPVYDACSPTGDGIMWMNYMDYTDDRAMHMFTAGQVAVMQAQVAPGGENETLTRHDSLLLYPPNAAVAGINDAELSLYPNPTTGQVDITYSSHQQLLAVEVCNAFGQRVARIAGIENTNRHISVNLANQAGGVYFVTCNFAAGNVTRKILVQ